MVSFGVPKGKPQFHNFAGFPFDAYPKEGHRRVGGQNKMHVGKSWFLLPSEDREVLVWRVWLRISAYSKLKLRVSRCKLICCGHVLIFAAHVGSESLSRNSPGRGGDPKHLSPACISNRSGNEASIACIPFFCFLFCFFLFIFCFFVPLFSFFFFFFFLSACAASRLRHNPINPQKESARGPRADRPSGAWGGAEVEGSPGQLPVW